MLRRETFRGKGNAQILRSGVSDSGFVMPYQNTSHEVFIILMERQALNDTQGVSFWCMTMISVKLAQFGPPGQIGVCGGYVGVAVVCIEVASFTE